MKLLLKFSKSRGIYITTNTHRPCSSSVGRGSSRNRNCKIVCPDGFIIDEGVCTRKRMDSILVNVTITSTLETNSILQTELMINKTKHPDFYHTIVQGLQTSDENSNRNSEMSVHVKLYSNFTNTKVTIIAFVNTQLYLRTIVEASRITNEFVERSIEVLNNIILTCALQHNISFVELETKTPGHIRSWNVETNTCIWKLFDKSEVIIFNNEAELLNSKGTYKLYKEHISESKIAVCVNMSDTKNMLSTKVSKSYVQCGMRYALLFTLCLVLLRILLGFCCWFVQSEETIRWPSFPAPQQHFVASLVMLHISMLIQNPDISYDGCLYIASFRLLSLYATMSCCIYMLNTLRTTDTPSRPFLNAIAIWTVPLIMASINLLLSYRDAKNEDIFLKTKCLFTKDKTVWILLIGPSIVVLITATIICISSIKYICRLKNKSQLYSDSARRHSDHLKSYMISFVLCCCLWTSCSSVLYYDSDNGWLIQCGAVIVLGLHIFFTSICKRNSETKSSTSDELLGTSTKL